MQPDGGLRKATAMFSALIARSCFIRLLLAQPMTRLEKRSKMTGTYAQLTGKQSLGLVLVCL